MEEDHFLILSPFQTSTDRTRWFTEADAEAEKLRKEAKMNEAEKLRKEKGKNTQASTTSQAVPQADQIKRIVTSRKETLMKEAEKLTKETELKEAEKLRKETELKETEKLRKETELKETEKLRKETELKEAENLRKEQEELRKEEKKLRMKEYNEGMNNKPRKSTLIQIPIMDVLSTSENLVKMKEKEVEPSSRNAIKLEKGKEVEQSMTSDEDLEQKKMEVTMDPKMNIEEESMNTGDKEGDVPEPIDSELNADLLHIELAGEYKVGVLTEDSMLLDFTQPFLVRLQNLTNKELDLIIVL